MRKLAFFVVFLSIFWVACSTETAPIGQNRTSVTNQQTTAETEPVADEKSVAQSTVGVSSNTSSTTTYATARTQRRPRLTVGQQVSLIKAEQVSDSDYNTDRKIVRNAELDLEAESPERAQQMITSIAEMKGGFVVESQQSMSNIKAANRDIATMTLRVPAEKFGETLEEIRQAGGRVISENVKGEDVTEEFIDIEAQLKAKKALEAQFMEIMKRASRVEEALEVQSELADVRGEIEKIEGRKRFLENKSSLSTIKIRIQTAQVIASATRGFGERFVEAFDAGMNVATGFLLGLMTFIVAILPFAVIIGLPTVIGFRYFWKRYSSPKSVSEIARDEIS
jgi:hypothetical protein